MLACLGANAFDMTVPQRHDLGMPAQNTLGSRLRELRKQRRLTQSALAHKANVDQSFISRIEREVYTNAGVDQLKKVAEALEVTLARLQGETVDDADRSLGVGGRLRKLREVSFGIDKEEEWAALLGVTADEVKAWESGLSPTPKDAISKLKLITRGEIYAILDGGSAAGGGNDVTNKEMARVLTQAGVSDPMARYHLACIAEFMKLDAKAFAKWLAERPREQKREQSQL